MPTSYGCRIARRRLLTGRCVRSRVLFLREIGRDWPSSKKNRSRGLKPNLVAARDVRAEARTYLRNNGNDNSNDNGNDNSNGNDNGNDNDNDSDSDNINGNSEKADPLRG